MEGMAEFRILGLRLLWWAVWAEFLLVRLLSRAGIYMPKTGTALQVYGAALTLGETAFNFSMLVGLVLLGAMLWRQRLGVVVPAGLALVLIFLAPGAAAPVGWSAATALAATGAIAVLGTYALRGADNRFERGALTSVLFVHLLLYATTGGQLAWEWLGLPGSMPGAGPLIRGVELVALLAPLPLAVGAWRSSPRLGTWAVGGAGALALALALWANGDMTAILAMYALGFSLSWPAALYVVPLLLGLPGLIALVRVAPDRGLAVGLLFLAGLSLTINQQHVLVLAAWTALAIPARAMEVRAA